MLLGRSPGKRLAERGAERPTNPGACFLKASDDKSDDSDFLLDWLRHFCEIAFNRYLLCLNLRLVSRWLFRFVLRMQFFLSNCARSCWRSPGWLTNPDARLLKAFEEKPLFYSYFRWLRIQNMFLKFSVAFACVSVVSGKLLVWNVFRDR